MADNPFVEGAIVYLKSGSPALTVENIKRADGMISVVWFDKQNHVQRDLFDPGALTFVDLKLAAVMDTIING